MRIVRVTVPLIGTLLFAACSEPPPPVSVTEFMENPRLLEATMVRCGQNRSAMKYEVECVNARDAINRLERAEERARRAELEAQSERKRQALRRTQEAAAAARRRAQEEQRRREEAEYLGIFEGTPTETGAAQAPQTQATNEAPQPAANAPAAEIVPVEVEEAPPEEVEEPVAESSDLGAVREELRRRQQAPNQN